MTIKTQKRLKKTLIITLSVLAFLYIFGGYALASVVIGENFKRIVNPDPDTTTYLTYNDVKDLPRRDVEFKSGKATLKGYVYGDGGNLVVVAHGLGGTQSMDMAEVMYFLSRDFRVFTFDYTGTGDSGGKNMAGVCRSVIDLDNALTFIEEDSELSRLPKFLFGHSWGGYVSGAVLNFDHDIKAAAIMAGFNDATGILDESGPDIIGGRITFSSRISSLITF